MTGPLRAARAPLVRLLAIAFFGCLLLHPAPAPGGDLVIDFPEAVSRAMRDNPSLAAAKEEWTAAKTDVTAARGLYLPSLTFEERFVRTNIPAEAFAFRINQERLLQSDFASVDNFNNPPPLNEYMTTLSAEQALFAPRLYLGYRMAGREAGAKGLEVRRRKEEVAFRVLSAYLGVLSAKESVGVAARAVADAKEHQRVAEAMERSGMGLASDVLRARVFLATATGGQVEEENRLELARRALALAIGEPAGTEMDAAAALPPLPEEGSLDDRIAQALAGRSDLRAVSVRVENAATEVNLQRSDYLPAVGLMAAWQADGGDGPFSPDNRSWKVGVGLKWNLFDGLRREAAVARSAAQRGRAEAYFRGARDQAAYEVSRAYLAVRAANRRVEIARSASAAAEEGMRLIKARYENQLARMVDLLDAQSALNAARAELVRAENDLRRSRGELLFASGTLLPWALPGTEEGR